jgi:hypothetical protein
MPAPYSGFAKLYATPLGDAMFRLVIRNFEWRAKSVMGKNMDADGRILGLIRRIVWQRFYWQKVFAVNSSGKSNGD